VRAQRVPFGQLDRDLVRGGRTQPALVVDLRQLGQLRLGLAGQLRGLPGQVGALGVALRADRHVLPGGHGNRAGHRAGQAGGDSRRTGRAGGGDPDQQAGGGHDAVVGTQHRGPLPARPVTAMPFVVPDAFGG